MAQGHKRDVSATGCAFDLHSSLEKEARERSNASRMWRKMGNGTVLSRDSTLDTKASYVYPANAGYSVKLKKYHYVLSISHKSQSSF